jgi:hypothetical protein
METEDTAEEEEIVEEMKSQQLKKAVPEFKAAFELTEEPKLKP